MPHYQVFLFGKLRILGEDGAERVLDSRKVQELFSYLIAYRERAHRREKLAELLWAENSSVQTKKYLRQGLWMLQSALNGGLTNGCSRLLLVEDGRVQVNPQADYWLDVAEFEACHASLHAQPAFVLTDQDTARLCGAISLYQNGFLTNCYQDWCLFERERLRRMCLELHHQLVAYYEHHRRFAEGINCGKNALRIDAANERIHTGLMRLYFLAGDRTEAIRQYERCAAALQQELGVAPSPQAQALYEQVRAGRLEPVDLLEHALTPPAPLEKLSLPEVLERLNDFQHTLNQVERQLHQQIQEIERLIAAANHNGH